MIGIRWRWPRDRSWAGAKGSRYLAIVAAAAQGFLAIPESIGAQETGSVTAAVYESGSNAPVSGAVVQVLGLDFNGVTDADGIARVQDVPAGSHVLFVEHPAYPTATKDFFLDAGDALTLAIYLEQEVAAPVSTSREIFRADIEAAVLQGLDLIELLTRSMPSVKVREGGLVGGYRCVEYRGSQGMNCRQLGLVIDGIPSQSPAMMFESLPLGDVYRLLLLTPSEAGTRYGGVGGWGMLLVETRRGQQLAQAAPAPRLISSFDWSEESEPYAWTQVLVSTTVASGIALAVSYETNGCLRLSRKVHYAAIRSECGSWGTVGSVLVMTALPSLSASLAARLAGRTERSHGRFAPTVLIGSAITVAGYVALLHGDAEDNRVASIGGITLLTVGTPVFTTLADRLFREIR